MAETQRNLFPTPLPPWFPEELPTLAGLTFEEIYHLARSGELEKQTTLDAQAFVLASFHNSLRREALRNIKGSSREDVLALVEDLVSETWVRALKNRQSWSDHPRQFSKWLKVILHHAFIDRVRRQVSLVELDGLEDSLPAACTEDLVVQLEAMRSLAQELAIAARLTKAQYRVIVALAKARLCGFDQDWAAKQVGTTPNAFRNALWHIRGRLRSKGLGW